MASIYGPSGSPRTEKLRLVESPLVLGKIPGDIPTPKPHIKSDEISILDDFGLLSTK